MRERPILFSGPMVRAILSDDKTQTRRVLKPRHLSGTGWTVPALAHAPTVTNCIRHLCPYGDVGDRLWVRETWRTATSLDNDSPKRIEERCLDAGYLQPWAPVQYEADGQRVNWLADFALPGQWSIEPGKTRVSIHMPRWASRLTLEVTSVRVERLQDISEADAQAEGMTHELAFTAGFVTRADGRPAAVRWFNALWERINGPDSWDANPWVWVVTFRESSLNRSPGRVVHMERSSAL